MEMEKLNDLFIFVNFQIKKNLIVNFENIFKFEFSMFQ